MILIAHRGNTIGCDKENENRPQYIDLAIYKGYSVEVDLWYVGGELFLGHDEPQYAIGISYLINKPLFCHAKNCDALPVLLEQQLNVFWHQNDAYTLTSKGQIWAYPGSPLVGNAIAVMPEGHYSNQQLANCAGICSDYIASYQ